MLLSPKPEDGRFGGGITSPMRTLLCAEDMVEEDGRPELCGLEAGAEEMVGRTASTDELLGRTATTVTELRLLTSLELVPRRSARI